ncbi:Aste57867_24138 [Aphanomyces stellatus]|uniref:Aste57867_24138 protein n=1 Tax=Aphanomyces stellatus TaxID=120398 RepID=A0A485KE60_9STRA|nr:hypothetical protein As57867_024064 [Aphanomyces stellatus]KAF0715289.1 hypothetical protein As57867_003447 [Aphanomyces stellatus]KAF0715293.1 hypothetical protein As57867_003451 [Aphanomyces stellatus]VFT80623.1 Aste57867_3457 [Aphanomyces stellatus]VFT80627.1 Aste57867_3461 [Aphanomyces stellatus]
MRPATSVLLSRDVVRLVCEYQSGICDDMRPFLPLRIMASTVDDVSDDDEESLTSIGALQAMANGVASVLPKWLASFSMDRLRLLFDCVQGVREPILVWAASTARLDVLMWVHIHYDLRVCSDNLLVAGVAQLTVLSYLHSIKFTTKTTKAVVQAATEGHVASLAFLLTEFQVPQNWLNGGTVSRVAGGGHREILAFLLPQLEQVPQLLWQVTTHTAAYNHIELAAWLYTQLVALDVPIHADDDTLESPLWIASTGGHVDGLEWLLNLVALVDATEVATWEDFCFSAATRYRQVQVVNFLIPRVSPTTIVETYLYDDSDGLLLHAVVDRDFNVQVDNDVVEMVLRWSLDKLRQVLDTFTLFQHQPRLRTDTLKKCLHRVVSFGRRMDLVPWLVGGLQHEDVQDVVITQKALHVGFLRGGVPMLDFFDAHDIHMPPTEIDHKLFLILRQARDKSVLPRWLDNSLDDNLDTANEDSIARWLVLRRGGRVAVFGRLLVRLAQGKNTLDQFKTLFNGWLSLSTTSDESNQVIQECMKHIRSPEVLNYFESLLVTDPSLFVLMAPTLHLGTVRKMHSLLAQTVSHDELIRLESKALVEAAAAGHCSAVQFLENIVNAKQKSQAQH